MTKLINTSEVHWKGMNITSVHYQGEKVWSPPVEDGVSFEVLTPTHGSDAMLLSKYISDVNIGGKVHASPDQVVRSDSANFNGLTFYPTGSETKVTTFMVTNDKVPASSELTITCGVIKQGSSKTFRNDYTQDRNLVFGSETHYVDISDKGTNTSKLVTPEGTVNFTFNRPTFDSMFDTWEFRIRFSQGVVKVYSDAKLLATGKCSYKVDIGKIRVGGNLNGYTKSGVTRKKYSGAPSISSLRYYTGDEAVKKAGALGLE